RAMTPASLEPECAVLGELLGCESCSRRMGSSRSKVLMTGVNAIQRLCAIVDAYEAAKEKGRRMMRRPFSIVPQSAEIDPSKAR
ncbi:MAG: hypothetical protein ABI777_11980, partial [Betaproteobacteria bacterium]